MAAEVTFLACQESGPGTVLGFFWAVLYVTELRVLSLVAQI